MIAISEIMKHQPPHDIGKKSRCGISSFRPGQQTSRDTSGIQLARVEYLSNRKRRTITMTYNKPEIVTLACSIKAIQGSSDKSMQNFPDTIGNPGYPVQVTSSAYEADE
jgi:hypothetical protein